MKRRFACLVPFRPSLAGSCDLRSSSPRCAAFGLAGWLRGGFAALLLGSAAIIAAGGQRAWAEPPAVLDALLGAERRTIPLRELAQGAKLAPDESFRVTEVGRDGHSSHHLVAIREGEAPHRHDRHDLFVVMLRGFGRMRLGAEERSVGPGSILYVPRGRVHAFRNAANEPAVAYAVYAPPFDGQDRVDVE